MPRIVHVSESLATGVLSVLSTLLAHQVDDGHEVHLIGSDARADTPAGWRSSVPAAVRFHRVSMQREIRPRHDLAAALELRELLGRLAPDLLHLHSTKAGALGRIATLGRKVRTIYQPHGLAFLRQDVPRRTRGLYALVEGGLAVVAGGTVVGCSEGEYHAMRGVVPRARRAWVSNGIELDRTRRAAPRKGEGPLRIGTCGRISPQKRPAFFAEVAAALRGEAELVWIGDGDAADRRLLEQAGVHVTGWRSRDEALSDVASLQIYVQTSAWEGLPISVIEAMAAGLPIVATDIVGNRDLLIGRDAGCLVDTPSEMVAALRALIDDPARRARQGREAHRIAHERYSARAMVRGYYALYGFPVAPEPAPELASEERLQDRC